MSVCIKIEILITLLTDKDYDKKKMLKQKGPSVQWISLEKEKSQVKHLEMSEFIQFEC